MSLYSGKQRLLVVDAPHFYAGATWEWDERNGWQCTKAAPIIKWMRGKSAEHVAAYLKRKRWPYHWV